MTQRTADRAERHTGTVPLRQGAHRDPRLHRRAEPVRRVRARRSHRVVLGLGRDGGAAVADARRDRAPRAPSRRLLPPKTGVLARVLRYLCVWAILFVSKFVILEVVAFVTAGRAALGHFFEVVAIVLALMAAEALLSWIYEGWPPTPAGERQKPESDQLVHVRQGRAPLVRLLVSCHCPGGPARTAAAAILASRRPDRCVFERRTTSVNRRRHPIESALSTGARTLSSWRSTTGSTTDPGPGSSRPGPSSNGSRAPTPSS